MLTLKKIVVHHEMFSLTHNLANKTILSCFLLTFRRSSSSISTKHILQNTSISQQEQDKLFSNVQLCNHRTSTLIDI